VPETVEIEMVMHAHPRSLAKHRTDDGMRALCKGVQEDTPCLRTKILREFVLLGMDLSGLTSLENRRSCVSDCANCACDLCTCCTMCRDACICQTADADNLLG
jgi:hypothetical protein